MPEDNRKQIAEEFYTNKYQKNIACSYGYKLVYVDDNFSKSFKTYLGKDEKRMILIIWSKEVNIAVKSRKKHFNNKLVMTKEEHEYFENSIKY